MKKHEILEFKIQSEIPLLKFLYQNIHNKSKNTIKALLKNGQVFVNSKKQTQYDFLLHKNDQVKIQMRYIDTIPCPILYEDESLIAIDKPFGLLTIATDKEKDKTAYQFIRNYLNKKHEKVFIIHRLDRDTSGILLFAKNEKMKIMLQKHWNDITLKRGYMAIIEGAFKPSDGTIRSYLQEHGTMVHSTKNMLDGKLAITRYKTFIKNEQFSLLEIFLETGRKNQIRVHMSEAGHPIIGDKKYGTTKDPLQRLGLHAHVLEFIHPFTKKVMHLESSLPESFERLFQK